MRYRMGRNSQRGRSENGVNAHGGSITETVVSGGPWGVVRRLQREAGEARTGPRRSVPHVSPADERRGTGGRRATGRRTRRPSPESHPGSRQRGTTPHGGRGVVR